MKIISPAMITLIMLIVVGALVAAYIGKSIFYRPAPVAQPPETRLVPMASTNIAAGTLITAQHLISGPIRRDKLSRDTILSRDAIVGRYALKDIKQASPIETNQLYGPKERPPLELKPGMQAITIGLGDSTSVVDGLIRPGNYVDLLLTVSNNSEDKRYRGGFTMRMFKGVKLLAINRMTQPADIGTGGNTVTLELTRKQANILMQAKQHGELTISYNPEGPGSGGVDVADEDRAYFDEILGLPVIAEPAPPFRLELYHGTSRSLIGFGEDREDDGRSGSSWRERAGWAPPRNGFSRDMYPSLRGYRGSYNENAPSGDNDRGNQGNRPASPGMAVNDMDALRTGASTAGTPRN